MGQETAPERTVGCPISTACGPRRPRGRCSLLAGGGGSGVAHDRGYRFSRVPAAPAIPSPETLCSARLDAVATRRIGPPGAPAGTCIPTSPPVRHAASLEEE